MVPAITSSRLRRPFCIWEWISSRARANRSAASPLYMLSYIPAGAATPAP